MIPFMLSGTFRKDVSMKSGLEGRNNATINEKLLKEVIVSMKSGLEGRNNPAIVAMVNALKKVSQ